MIIGISGKKQHGKDTVAQIIQYLTQKKDTCFSDYGEYLSWKKNPKEYPESLFFWQIHKFADKLKDCVCLLIGCTREQLEDEEFKNTPLSSEWDCFMETSSWGPKASMYMENPHSFHSYKRTLTPRRMLQLLGTDCGRNIIHPNIWVNATMVDYKEKDLSKSWSDKDYKKNRQEQGYPYGYPDWIIPDVRFPNEVQAIKDKHGIIIRVERPSVISNDNHESETALDNYDFGYNKIINDGSIDGLIKIVEGLLKHHKII